MLTNDGLSPYTPISIYYDSRIKDIEAYKVLFKNLVNGEVTNGAHVEKLKNYNIYSIRIDGKGRILFTYSQINKKKCLVVLEVLENHEYDKSKFLKKKVLKKYLEENQPELVSMDFESVVISTELIHSRVGVSFEMVYENKQSYIVLDPEQQFVLNAKTPFLIEGPPGSGKTTLAQSLIKQALERGQTVLYVTPCASLAKAVRLELSACPEYDPMKVQVLVYDELLEPGLVVNGKQIFKEWYQKFVNNQDKNKFSELAIKIEQVFEEFKIISGFSEEVYISKDGIGKKQTLLGLEQNNRKWLFSLYQTWNSYLEKNKIRLCDFYVFKKEEIKSYDFIVVDESQYLSHIPILNLLSMTKNNNIVICSDRRQNPHDEKQKTIHLKEMLTKYQNGIVPEVICLSSHYRCPENIMNFALVFNDVRLQMATDQKSEPKVIGSKIPGGSTLWFEPDEKEGLQKIKEMRQNADVCVVTPEKFKEEAKRLCITQIFTPEEVVGLEYKTVILYKILETQQMFLVNQWLNKKTTNQATEANCAADLSACFLASTRATDSLIIVQNSKEHKLATLISRLKESMPAVNNETVQPIKMVICSSDKEWMARAKQAFENDKLDDAKTILVVHLRFPEEEAKAIITFWQDEEVVKEPAKDIEKVVEVKKKSNHRQGFSKKQNAKPTAIQQKNGTKIAAQPVAAPVPSTKNKNFSSQVSKEFHQAVSKAADGQSGELIGLLHKPEFTAAHFTIPIDLTWGNALCILVAAASNGHPEGLRVVLEKHRNAFKTEDFSSLRNKNAFANILFGLATRTVCNPEGLLALLLYCPNVFKAADFTACEKAGEHKGKSALWWLAGAGHPLPFFKVFDQYSNTFKAEDFTACAQTGPDKGKSALWLLSVGVVRGNLQNILKVLTQYRNQFRAEDFTACPQAGPDKDKNALWVLASAAAKDHPEGLLAVLDQYSHAFKAEDFTACVQAGADKGKSALWLLAAAVAKGHPQSFLKVLTQYPNKFKAADFTACVEGTGEGKSVLWWLACGAAEGYPEGLLALLQQYPNAFKAQDFTICAQAGNDKGNSALGLLIEAAHKGDRNCIDKVLEQYPGLAVHIDKKVAQPVIDSTKKKIVEPQVNEDLRNAVLRALKGQSDELIQLLNKPELVQAAHFTIPYHPTLANALCMLVDAAGAGHPEGLLAVLEKHRNAFKTEDFRAFGNKSAILALQGLAIKTANGHPEGLLALLEQYPNAFKAEDFIAHAQAGMNEGKSALWWLADAAARGRPQGFLKVLAQYSNKFKVEDFTACAQAGSDKGESTLWLLAGAAANGRPEALLAVLEQYPNAFKAEDFTTCAQAGVNEGKSALWWLAIKAAKGSPQSFLKVLAQYSNKFKMEDFTACVQAGEDKGKSVLWLLAGAAANGRPEALLAVLEQYPNAFKAEDFTACAQAGVNEGKSALWWLAGAAAEGRPQSLLVVLEQYSKKFKVEDFTACAQAGLQEGKSALWWLAGAAVKGHSEVLLAVLKQYPNAFKAEDFTACVQAGVDKGTSTLWLLAGAAVKGHSEVLLAVLKQYPNAFKAEDFTACAQAGVNEGKSALWRLAITAAKGSPRSFLKVLAQYSHKFKMEDFTACVQAGEDKGKSVLWLLAGGGGHLEGLMAVLKQYPNAFSADDFTACPQAGLDKGTSALWWLAGAAANGSPEGLLAVLEQYSKDFKAEDFTACAQAGENKGESALWWLAYAASQGHPQGFLKVLAQYPNAFKAEDFTACAQAGVNEGKSALWWLAGAAANGRPECLLAVLEQYPNAIKAEDFTACAQAGVNEGKSALWWLAGAATNGRPECLLAVLEQYPNAFKAEDFTACAQAGSDKGTNALWWLACAAAQGRPQGFLKVLEQYPNAFKAEDFTACAQAGVNKGKSALCWLKRTPEEGYSEGLLMVLAQYPELQMMIVEQELAQLTIAADITSQLLSAPILNQFQNLSLQAANEIEDCSTPVSPPFANRC